MVDGYRQYKETSIHTASPEQLVVMLYEGALRFLEEARQRMAAGCRDGADGYDAPLTRAEDIIIELLTCLNMEVGEMSTNLAKLYDFFLFRLTCARAKNDATVIGEVIGLVRQLRDAFAGAAQQVRKEREQERSPSWVNAQV